MSARKTNPSTPRQAASPNPTLLHLSSDQVYVRKNGIEFRSETSIPVWTEMTIDLATNKGDQIECNGVIVSCSGNRHTGFQIAMVFTGMSPQHQRQLDTFASASL